MTPPAAITNAALLAPFFAAILFAILYASKAPWWRTWMGRNLFFFDIAVTFALLPGALKILFGVNSDSDFFMWLLVADLGFVTLLILHRCYLLIRVQKGWNWVRSKRHDVPLPDVPAAEETGKKERLCP